jgi:hypothetical protein
MSDSHSGFLGSYRASGRGPTRLEYRALQRFVESLEDRLVLSALPAENLTANCRLDEAPGTGVTGQVNSTAADGVFRTAPQDPSCETSSLPPIPGHLAVLRFDGRYDGVTLDPNAFAFGGSYTIAWRIYVSLSERRIGETSRPLGPLAE